MSDALLMERARDIAKKALDGEYDLLLACRDLAGLRARFPAIPADALDTFDGVASEVDGLPIGPERVYWNAEALRLKDIEAADYRTRVGGSVKAALRILLRATDTVVE